MIIYMILFMSTTLLIRHLIGQEVTLVDGRRPLAAYPRYIGRLDWDTVKRRYSVGVYGLDFLVFRLAQVVRVEGNVITLGNPYRAATIDSYGTLSG
jgi:hypothetical protein